MHYGVDYDNAFWDGERMVFGDGDGEVFVGFTASTTVIGHELAHGVVQYTANLEYQGQPGALNESIADVFGALTEQFLLEQSATDATWLIGAEIFTDAVQGKALRSMIEPGTAYDDDELGKDPQPAHMSGFVRTTEDNGGVHINSGIPNRAFALFAIDLGGNAWETRGHRLVPSAHRRDSRAPRTSPSSPTRRWPRHPRSTTPRAPPLDARGRPWESMKMSESPPPTDAQVVIAVVRTGGIAGIRRQWQVEPPIPPTPTTGSR